MSRFDQEQAAREFTRHEQVLKSPEQQYNPPNVGQGIGPGECYDPKAGMCTTEYRPNPRRLIEERIQYHNQQANELHSLLRALPQEMSREAENVLAKLLLDARPRR